MEKQASLYIHIPFCIKRCSYCDFTTQTDNSSELIENYIRQICKEIISYKNDDISIGTIFFGGGTPSVLRIDQLERIFESIHSSFNLKNCIETTIEINPVNLNRNNLKKYLKLGINRLSMGVQTFDENLLKMVNRNHSVSDIYKTYNSAREAGFKNFSLDLIFGLPYQTQKIWEDTLEKALALNSEHISLYGLDLHDNTPLYKEVKTGITKLPEEELTLTMFEYAGKYLKDSGFIHYEISNWCKKGFEAKHNLVYWYNHDYIGVGVSAASFYNRIRYTNTHELTEYLRLDNFSTDKPQQSFKEELEETIFMNLRLLDEGLDINKVNARFGIDVENYYKKEIQELIKLDLLIIQNNKLKLTEKAVFVSNEVFGKFIR